MARLLPTPLHGWYPTIPVPKLLEVAGDGPSRPLDITTRSTDSANHVTSSQSEEQGGQDGEEPLRTALNFLKKALEQYIEEADWLMGEDLNGTSRRENPTSAHSKWEIHCRSWRGNGAWRVQVGHGTSPCCHRKKIWHGTRTSIALAFQERARPTVAWVSGEGAEEGRMEAEGRRWEAQCVLWCWGER